jgi:hypothetical protein
MVVIRRLLLLWLLMFWLGGFTFYAGVVVPIGTDVLGSASEQGVITRQVTNWLNLAGAVALGAWSWDLAANPAPSRTGQRLRWLLWLVLVALHAVLACLHPWMAALLDAEQQGGFDPDVFRALHRSYLWVSTVQWGGAVALSAVTVWTWRITDRRG